MCESGSTEFRALLNIFTVLAMLKLFLCVIVMRQTKAILNTLHRRKMMNQFLIS